jgi:hypothetical protein
MKNLFLLVVVIGMFSCNNVNDAIEPIGPFVYSIQNIDYDGKVGTPEFIYVNDGWKDFNDVKSEIPESELLEENNTVLFKVGCMTFQTFICYDGVAGNTTMTANGGRFGLKITCNDCPDQDPQFSIKTNKVSIESGTISSPFSGFELNKLIKVSDVTKYAEPQTGIIWGDGMFVSTNPRTVQWDLTISGQEVGSGTKYKTKITFNQGDIIDQTEVCSSFALPIDWVRKPTGKREGFYNLIKWNVNEYNVDYFLIKRSRYGAEDFKDWEVVGKVYSKIKNGDRGIAVQYQFLDSTPKE